MHWFNINRIRYTLPLEKIIPNILLISLGFVERNAKIVSPISISLE